MGGKRSRDTSQDDWKFVDTPWNTKRIRVLADATPIGAAGDCARTTSSRPPTPLRKRQSGLSICGGYGSPLPASGIPVVFPNPSNGMLPK
ncbi:MAG: hypothetical protein LBB18_02580 [Puniceicoccales bacterium]|nr:hypothetical protein [Puniceicoccales bacterium]